MNRGDFLKTLSLGSVASILPAGLEAEIKGTENANPAKGEIAVVNIRPNDYVLLMYPQRLRPEDLMRLDQLWKEYVPDVHCIVLDSGARLGVLRPDEKDA